MGSMSLWLTSNIDMVSWGHQVLILSALRPSGFVALANRLKDRRESDGSSCFAGACNKVYP